MSTEPDPHSDATRSSLLQRWLTRIRETAVGEPDASDAGRADATPWRVQERPHYQYLSPIAEGGMGEVHCVKDTNLGREMAIKVLKKGLVSDEGVLARFIEEAQVGGQLQHPGIVPVYDIGLMADARPYFAMKLVRGRTLKELLNERPDAAADRRRFLGIFEQVCQTVAYAHVRGVIHRDLKPSNVMVGAFGEVQVVDWGLAKIHTKTPREELLQKTEITIPQEPPVRTVRSEDTETGSSLAGTVLGTPPYMSPEQARGETDSLDARSDVFSLGAILCEILTMAPPFRGANPAVVLGRAGRGELQDAYDRLDACGADVELINLTKQCLQKEPGARPASAKEVADAVAGHLSSVEERARAAQIEAAEARVRAASERKARQLTMALAIFVILTIGAAGGGFLWMRGEREARAARTANDMRMALDDATEARLQKDWSRALASARHAVALAGSPDAPGEFAERARTVLLQIEGEAEVVRAQAAREERYQKLVAAFDGVRPPDELKNPNQRLLEMAKQYNAVFRSAEIDVTKIELPELLKIARELGHPVELAAMLDAFLRTWIVPNDPIVGAKLYQCSNAIDPDAQRGAIRKAMVEGNLESLMKFAGRSDLQEHPDTTLVLLASALHDGNMNGRESALRILQIVLRRSPDHYLAALLYATYNTEPGGDPAVAMTYFRVAMALRPKASEALHQLGILLEEYRADSRGAEEVYRMAIEVLPKDAHLCMHLGKLLSRRGDNEQAMLYLQKAREMNPADVQVVAAIADNYTISGNLQKALEAADAAIALDSSQPMIFSGRIEILEKLGRVDEALAAARDLVSRFPKDRDALAGLAGALERSGDRAAALAAWEEIYQLSPAWGRTIYNYSRLRLMQKNDADTAVQLLTNSMRTRRLDAREYVLLSDAQGKKGDWKGALASARAAVAADPNDASAHERYGVLLSNVAGDVGEAIIQLRKSIELDAKVPTTHGKLAFMLAQTGKNEEALREARTAIELSPNDGSIYYILGYVNYKSGASADAVRAVEKARALGYEPEAALLLHADSLRQVGQEVKQREVLREGHSRWPENTEFLQKLGYSESRNGDPAAGVDAMLKVCALKNAPQPEGFIGLAFAHARAGDLANATKTFAEAEKVLLQKGGTFVAMRLYAEARDEIARLRARPSEK